jgi:hypothetical protein
VNNVGFFFWVVVGYIISTPCSLDVFQDYLNLPRLVKRLEEGFYKCLDTTKNLGKCFKFEIQSLGFELMLIMVMSPAGGGWGWKLK